MKYKKFLLGGLLVVLGCVLIYLFFFRKSETTISDGEKFASEYTKVNKDNVFVYRTGEEVLKILENGNGLVFLGFPECPWCQGLVPIINDIAKESGISKVYYFNIKEDRANNTELYKNMVKLLTGNLRYDEEGNERIYAPSLIAVKDGEIVSFEDTRNWDNKSYSSPDEFWNNADLSSIKEKVLSMAKEVKEDNICKNDCD